MKKTIRRPKIRFDISWWFFIVVIIEITLTMLIATLAAAVLTLLLDNVVPISERAGFWISSIIIIVIISLFINRKLVKPIININDAMAKVAAGDFSVRLQGTNRINEVFEIYNSFNAMAEELGKIEMLQSDFVSSVSHEIKTPINAIEGYAMLLQDSSCTEDEREKYIDKIMFNTKRLSELSSNILLLSKLENGVADDKKGEYRVDEQIRQSIMLLEPKWTEKNIDMDVDLEDIMYFGNNSLMFHVWSNLISNAIKFSPSDSAVKIRLVDKEKHIEFTIEDQGPGVSDEEKRHMFDKFFQGDSSHKQEGNGLGLALVKKIVELNNGEIMVENLPAKGCRFTIMLYK